MDFVDNSAISERALFLVLTINCFGTTRKLSNNDFEVDAEKTRIRANKQLLECKEKDAIKTFDGQTKKWIEGHCLPCEFRGTHAMPNAMLDDIESYLTARNDRREELITQLLDVYPQVKQRDRIQLRGTFNEDDYPTVSEVRSQYSMKWRYVIFQTPTNLKDINRAVFQREKEKNARLWAETGVLADQLLHKTMTAFIKQALDKLSGSDSGKRKVFHKTYLPNLNDFLATFNVRNINSNAELQELANRMKDAINGVELDDLKKNEDTRDYVRRKFEKIGRHLDTMMIDRPSRAISLEEEESFTTV